MIPKINNFNVEKEENEEEIEERKQKILERTVSLLGTSKSKVKFFNAKHADMFNRIRNNVKVLKRAISNYVKRYISKLSV